MANIYGRNNFGLFTNGDFRNGDVTNFTWGTYNNTDQYQGIGCLEYTGGGGSSAFSNEFALVDTNKTYQMILYARTLQKGSTNNDLAGGHLGFACYDQFYNFIDLRNCGGVGNTTLSRPLSAGDSYAYLTSSTGWYTGADVTSNSFVFRHVLFFPSTHPYYSAAHKYTRIGYGEYNIYYKSLVQTGSGDWELKFADSAGNDTTFPNIGYVTPTGTPVSIGQAGGSYNYALGAPNYPEEWTRYATPPFTGESRNSTYPFRYSTKYIKFLVLRNYNNRTDTPQDHKWALDNIMFTQCIGGVDYRDRL